jgi:SIR2-like protein
MSNTGLDPHYAAVVPILAEGRVVPFLGAGVNRAGRAPDTVWREGSSDLPDGRELARWLAAKVGFSEDEDDLPRVAQYTETTLGDGELYHRLHQVFDSDPAPTRVHDFLASLPRRLRCAQERRPELRIQNTSLLIATTNYDHALERAFQMADERYDVVTYMAKGSNAGRFEHLPDGEEEPRPILVPNEYGAVSPSNRTVILKLHGAVDRVRPQRDSYVVSEDNYIDYLAAAEAAGILPVTLAAKLQSSHILFLGYGLKDWNLRVILRRLWGAQELSFTSWAVQLAPDAVEERFWKQRNVEIRDAELATYIAALSKRLASYLHEGPKPLAVAS